MCWVAWLTWFRKIGINGLHKAIINSFDVDNSNKIFFVWFFVIPQQNKQKYLLIKLFSVRRTYIIKEHNSIITSLVSSRRPPCCCSGRPIGGAAAPLFIPLTAGQFSVLGGHWAGSECQYSVLCCVVCYYYIILYMLPVTCYLQALGPDCPKICCPIFHHMNFIFESFFKLQVQ